MINPELSAPPALTTGAAIVVHQSWDETRRQLTALDGLPLEVAGTTRRVRIFGTAKGVRLEFQGAASLGATSAIVRMDDGDRLVVSMRTNRASMWVLGTVALVGATVPFTGIEFLLAHGASVGWAIAVALCFAGIVSIGIGLGFVLFRGLIRREEPWRRLLLGAMLERLNNVALAESEIRREQ